ncbi:hypothetical protein [Streptomyces kronopolitis]|uniref:hypothetical protein n=1 Tax=Streptomyces kronopolitis TaxID=1612435 RepID=UPI00343F1433
MADRPYAHLSNEALRDAIRKADNATRGTRAAAEKDETKAQHAKQQAAAGAGPNVLALNRSHQDLTERAEAIRDVRTITGSIAHHSAKHREVSERLQQLTATGRFGRPALRGGDRASAEADREELLCGQAATKREMEQLITRLDELSPMAGPTPEHEDVLIEATEAPRDREAVAHQAQAKNNARAKSLQTDAVRARSTADRAANRYAGLRAELASRRTTASREATPVSAYGYRRTAADAAIQQTFEDLEAPPSSPLP